MFICESLLPVVRAVSFLMTIACAQGGVGNDLPSLMHFPDGTPVRSMEDWEKRREQVRSMMVEHFIGTFPSSVPPVVETGIVSDETPGDGSRRYRVRLTLGTASRVSFEMAVWKPDAEGPYPLLLVAPRDYQLAWGEDALKRGYAVCLFPGVDSHHRNPDYPGYDSVWQKIREEYPEATWTEISTKGWLAGRCLDYLLSDESPVEVRSGQVAIIGFSRYGKQAMIAAAFDERITAVVARSPGSPASSPYRLTSRHTFAEAPADFPGEWFLPGLRDYLGREDELPMDAHGWYSLIAPRPCLIHTAHNDGAEPTFAVEKAYIEGRAVYEFLGASEKLRVDYRPGGHRSSGPEIISTADRARNLDWIDLAFNRGTARQQDFEEQLLHDFNWDQWREAQDPSRLRIERNAPIGERIDWLLGETPESITVPNQPEFLTGPESDLMTHDRWAPSGVRRVPIRFGDGVRGNLYFPDNARAPLPVVIWLHPYSYHSGYNEGYGVQGTTIYHRLAQNGFAVVAYDQCGFGLRLLEGSRFYQDYPQWSLLGRMVHDARAAVRFVTRSEGQAQSAVPEMDADRVFVLGYSVGSLTAVITAALEDQVAGMASFSGWTPWRTQSNDRLSRLHALLPALGLYDGRENELPLDFHDILNLAARKPCLVVTPRRDRFASFEAITSTMNSLQKSGSGITWLAPDDTNRFQADQHRIFLGWVKKAGE
jgi:dienelactone hydrolase